MKNVRFYDNNGNFQWPHLVVVYKNLNGVPRTVVTIVINMLVFHFLLNGILKFFAHVGLTPSKFKERPVTRCINNIIGTTISVLIQRQHLNSTCKPYSKRNSHSEKNSDCVVFITVH